MKINEITQQIIGAAIEVHKTLGPGLLESSYEECLCYELSQRKMQFKRQLSLPLNYKGIKLDCGYRLDLLVEDMVVLELKAASEITKIDEAQLMTYLKLGQWPVGLLINFNVEVLKDGIVRRVNHFKE